LDVKKNHLGDQRRARYREGRGKKNSREEEKKKLLRRTVAAKRGFVEEPNLEPKKKLKNGHIQRNVHVFDGQDGGLKEIRKT